MTRVYRRRPRTILVQKTFLQLLVEKITLLSRTLADRATDLVSWERKPARRFKEWGKGAVCGAQVAGTMEGECAGTQNQPC